MAYKPQRPRKKKVIDGYSPPYSNELLQKSIDDLVLTEEVLEKLKAAGITTIFAVVMLTERALLHVNRFNKKNLAVLVKALKSKGLDIRPTPQPNELSPTKDKKTPNENKDNFRDKGEVQRKQGQRTPSESSKSRTFIEGGQERISDTGKEEDFLSKDNEFLRNQSSRRRDARSGGKSKRGSKSGEKRTSQFQDSSTTSKRTKASNRNQSLDLVERDEYIKINRKGLWGFEDRQGKEIVPCLYDELFNFKEDLCCVMKDEKYGFIDRQGEIIIPLEYDLALSFNEGYSCVFKRDACGYIDKENNVVVPFLYEAGTQVQDGECRVKKAGSWGELHIATPDVVRWII